MNLLRWGKEGTVTKDRQCQMVTGIAKMSTYKICLSLPVGYMWEWKKRFCDHFQLKSTDQLTEALYHDIEHHVFDFLGCNASLAFFTDDEYHDCVFDGIREALVELFGEEFDTTE